MHRSADQWASQKSADGRSGSRDDSSYSCRATFLTQKRTNLLFEPIATYGISHYAAPILAIGDRREVEWMPAKKKSAKKSPAKKGGKK